MTWDQDERPVFRPTHDFPVNIPTIDNVYHRYIFENRQDSEDKCGRASLGNLGFGRLQAFICSVIPLGVIERNEIIASVMRVELLEWMGSRLGLALPSSPSQPQVPTECLFVVYLGALWYQWGERNLFYWLCGLYKSIFIELEQRGIKVPAFAEYVAFKRRHCQLTTATAPVARKRSVEHDDDERAAKRMMTK